MSGPVIGVRGLSTPPDATPSAPRLPAGGGLLGAQTRGGTVTAPGRRKGRRRSGSGLAEHADQLAAHALGRGLFGAEPDAHGLAAVLPQVCDDLEAVAVHR